MTKMRHTLLTATFLMALGGLQPAAAAIISVTLGNDTPGFADGSVPSVFPQLINAQSGQPAPFESGKGSDLFANLDESWIFNYAAIGDTILSASLTLGIADHDSQATGNQVALYEIDNNDLTSALNTRFEAVGGGDGEYNVYSLDLDSGLFADLTDGMAIIELTLLGPGLQTALIGGAVSETPSNGAHLIFSTLTIETRDITIPAVPIPAALPLFMSALFALGLFRRRISGSRV